MRPVIRLSLATLALAAATLGGCAPLRGHEGYVVDADLVNSLQPGVDTRQSVQQVLGKPTLTSQFGGGEWYYVARDTRNFAFNDPHPVSQTTLRVRFDDKGVVTGVDTTGLDQVASISPSGETTPTLGRKRSFFDELFGNIGTVGTGAGGTGGGAGSDTP